MPAIVIDQLVGDLIEYLPLENTLTDSQLENIATNIVANKIPEDDDLYYSEALCKSLKVAAIMNHMHHTVGAGSLKKEQVDRVVYEYSEENQRDIWKSFEQSLPNLCPYLPGGGYNMPTTLGMLVRKGEEIKITSCPENDNLIL